MASLEHDSGAKAAGEEHVEYDSDSDDGTSALALRRRVASDDEEDDEETNNERRDDYYAEAHEGGPPAEDEDEEEEEEDEEGDEDGEEYEDAEDEGGIGDRRKDVSEDYADEDGVEGGSSHFSQDARKPQGGVGTASGAGKEGIADEKKDAEPFVVPTAGAFYMHDDRFRYNGIARPRRSAGGRKLWEAKDEKPWVHDRFEELKLSDESYPGQGVRGRRGRGRQGRVQGRGKDVPRARGRGYRDKVFDDPLQSSRRGLGRGHGLRRAKMDDYEFRESRSVSQKAPSSSSHDATGLPATASMQKSVPSQPTSKPQEGASKKPTSISSMLNISSPPFFPTGTISQNMQGFGAGTSKNSEEKSVERDTPQVRRLVNTSRSGMEREMAGFSSASVTRLPSNLGVNSSVVPNGDVETGLHRSLARTSSTPQQQLSKQGSGSITQQHRVVRAEATAQHVIEQPLLSSAPQQSSRGPPPTTQSVRVQSLSVHPPQHPGKGSSPATQTMRVQQPHQQLQAVNQGGQASSGQPLQSQAVVSPVSFPAKPGADLKAVPASVGSNLGSGAMGRGAQAAGMPAAGRGALVYGSSSLTNGLRSVVQFAGQPQGGLGVPTVGVALPGYSSQPQFSFPNSEVTWIPILAGGGSLNSNYSSPYIAVDGGAPSGVYYAQQPSQVSAFPPTGRDPNGSKTAASNSFKPPSRTEPDDLGQQRRRYSQMTFGEERR